MAFPHVTSHRDVALRLVSDALGAQRLIWVGVYGREATTLLDLPQFTHCFSFAAAMGRELSDDFSIESVTGFRKLEQTGWAYANARNELSNRLGRACEPEATVLSFMPHPFLDELSARHAGARYLGMPWQTFERLNTKTYVEAGLHDVDGVKLVPWQPLPDDAGLQRAVVREKLRKGPVMLRASFSQAGIGHELIEDRDALRRSRLIGQRRLAVGPYFREHVPLAVGCCVFPDGRVTLHSPSVQLIGIEQCTNGGFGYCGNDFGAIKHLDGRLLEKLEQCAIAVGGWLHQAGYVGVFGLDAMIFDDDVWFTEINPRFHGATWLSASMDAAMDLPDIILDHCMAWLGIEPGPTPPLAALVQMQPSRSQIRVYNQLNQRIGIDATMLAMPPGISLALLPESHVVVEKDEVLAALVLDERVTEDGRSLKPIALDAVERAQAAIVPQERFRTRRELKLTA